MKICAVGAELFLAGRQTEGRTDRQTARHNKVNSRLSLVCETPKNWMMNKVQYSMSLNYQIVSEIKFAQGRKQL